MISIARDSGLITVISTFSCDPAQQAGLVDAWREAIAEFGPMPSVVAAALHRSVDGTRVVNYGQVRSLQDLEKLREMGRAKEYIARLTRFGQPDSHVYEVVYMHDRTATS